LRDRSTSPSGNGSSPVAVENFTRQFDSIGAIRSAILSNPWHTRQIQPVARKRRTNENSAWRKIDGDGNAAGVKRSLAGFFTGIDRRFGENRSWRTPASVPHRNSRKIPGGEKGGSEAGGELIVKGEYIARHIDVNENLRQVAPKLG
jgi:hypothetical protein